VVGEENEPDRAGFLVAHDDCQTYAEKLEALLADPALRRRFGEQGHARYLRRFTAQRMAGEYAALVRGGG
jgi:glycosyltransferase involved in cell wall biosynthesis